MSYSKTLVFWLQLTSVLCIHRRYFKELTTNFPDGRIAQSEPTLESYDSQTLV